jgi:hypothetical protein
VRLDTLDNPGWTLEIDLRGTGAENRTLEPIKIERTEKDWIHYRVAEKKFRAAMGPQNLAEGIEAFFRWLED